MIENEAQLKLIHEQLGRVESALLSMRETFLTRSPAKYALMAESYLSEYIRLRAEVDAYLGLESAYAVQPYLVIGLEGKGIKFRETPLSVVANALGRLHRAFELLGEASAATNDLNGRSGGGNGPICDPPLLGIAPRGLRILLGQPYFEDFAGAEATAFRHAIELLLAALEATNGATDASLNGGACDEKRRALYEALLYIAPSLDGEIETVCISGRAVGDRSLPALTKTSTRWLQEEIRRLDQAVAEDSSASHTH